MFKKVLLFTLALVVSSEVLAQFNADAIQNDVLGQYAQNSSRKKKKVRRSNDDFEETDSRPSGSMLHRNTVKPVFGLVSGFTGANPFALGADYVIPLDQPSLAVNLGVLYWSVAGFSIITLEGGVGYFLPINRTVELEFGGRAGMAMSSGDSVMLITPHAGVSVKLGPGAIGGELRLPFSLSSSTTWNVTYFLGTYRIFL